MRTHDVAVYGRHEDFFAKLTKTGLPFLKGTRLTVWMPAHKTTTPEHAQFLIEQSSLTKMAFTINGQRVKDSLPQGKLILDKPITLRGREVGRLLGYHSARAKRSGVYVRSHGIYMYEIQGYSDDFKGVVTVEVNAPPIDIFTMKRDSLSYESSARADVQAMLKELATDPRKSLRSTRDKTETVFRGEGLLKTREGLVAELAADALSKVDVARAKRRKKSDTELFKLDAGTATALTRMVTDGLGRLAETRDDPLGLAGLAEGFNTLMAGAEFVSVEQITLAVRMAMWKPDFLLYQNISPWKMPKALHPETMAKKYHELLRTWSEICRFVLVQLGIDKPFGVGWVFDTEYDYSAGGEMVIGALHRQFEDTDWLLLNPVEISVAGRDPYTYTVKGDRFSLSDPQSVEGLVALAIHEVTHMQGFASHTDAYAGALTQNMKVIFRLAPLLKKIIREAKTATKATRERTQKDRAPQGERRVLPGTRLRWVDVRNFSTGFDADNNNVATIDVVDVDEVTLARSGGVQFYSNRSFRWTTLFDPNQPVRLVSRDEAKALVECAIWSDKTGDWRDCFTSTLPIGPDTATAIRWAEGDNDDWLWGYRGPNTVALLRRVGGRWELSVSVPNGALLPEWELAADRNAPATARDLEAAKRVAECAVAEVAKTPTAVWEPRDHEEYRYGTLQGMDSTVISTRRASNGYVPRIWVGGEWVSMRRGHEDEARAMVEAEAAYRFHTCVNR